MPDLDATDMPIHWTKDPRAGTAESPIPLTPNQHWTIDPETGKRVVDFDFVEEPLGMPAERGLGFPQFDFGDVLQGYTVLRKLGWGMTSSTCSQQFFALKALSGHWTELSQTGRTWELHALEQVKSKPHSHCLQLLENFIVAGKGSAGSHLCLVTPLLGGDIKNYARTRNILRFPLSIAKAILRDVLRALACMHECGVIHTDLKSDNVLFDNSLTCEEISSILRSDPSRRQAAEASWDGIVHAALSQPLPMPVIQDFAERSFILGDLGSAQPIDPEQRTTDIITPPALRAPEVYLGGPWNEKVDIWSFGCLVYEVTVGLPLFSGKPLSINGVELDETEGILFEMTAHAHEFFWGDQLSVSKNAGLWFTSDCWLKKNPPAYALQTETFITKHSDGDVGLEDAKEIVRLLRRCLRLDPKNRPSARELLEDPWFV
ncbi:hypothetical protein VNI00_004840 [Paramarasmius palmivorus]|uniref:Protein kinase domain-containing protein n=1 Tax=Paramarasmius palmivorus TaxID=297713 RepID=A0AAW0DLL2_9AGAR